MANDNERYLRILNQVKGESKLQKNLDDEVLIIDGLNTFIRCFSVNPSLNDDGEHIGGLIGSLKSISYIIKTLRPTRCIVVFDGKGGSAQRRKWYPNYKSNRKTRIRLNRGNEHMTLDDERRSMKMQLLKLVRYLNLLPITVVTIDGIEADDTIAYISEQILTNSKITIMSSDKDFLQLVDDRVSVWNPLRKTLYEPKNILEDYGIPSHNFVLYRALDGDKSDNIPGVKSVGLKTLQNKFDILQSDDRVSVDEVVSFCKQHLDKGKIFANILDNKDTFELNYRLMQLRKVEIPNNTKMKILNSIRTNQNTMDKVQFEKYFMEDKLWSAIPNLHSWLSLAFNNLNTYVKEST